MWELVPRCQQERGVGVLISQSASFTQYIVTITQFQESVSDFNPESESGNF